MIAKNQPTWLDNAVFYEIYPQSFCDSNGDGIGDFNGIISKLDYISELGCNAIWLNPCFDSPFGDAGYDVSDYCSAAPRYGTNEDLKKLFTAVHSRGMHIILDLVPGHTSVAHPWFKESMKAERNEFTDRYVWTDSIWEEPAGMASLRGISERDGSCAVNFFSHQPALNYGFYMPDRLARSIHGVNLKIAFAFLLSMPGAPFIYYGDEIGMRYIENHPSVEGGYSRTGSRSPMQWDNTTNAGFSSAPKEKLYIHQDESADRPTVKAQIADKDSLYNEVKRLIEIRKSHSALLSRGEIEFVFAEKNAYPLAYLRSGAKERILVIINPADRKTEFDCKYTPKEKLYSIGGNIAVSESKITVPPQFAGYYVL